MEEVVRYYPRVYLSEPDTPTPSVLHPSFFLQTLHLHLLHPCLPPWRRMSSSACSKVTFSVRSIRFVVIQSLGRVCLAGSKSWVEWLKMWRESCNRSRSGFWCHRVRFRHLCISFVLGASFLPTHCLLSFRQWVACSPQLRLSSSPSVPISSWWRFRLWMHHAVHHFTIFISFPQSCIVECDDARVHGMWSCLHEHPQSLSCSHLEY